ncbi:MAG: hypothetical protein ACI9DH_001163 [Halioglobus sp.]|jgi:hypothetical protein
MAYSTTTQTCSCPCGESTFEVLKRPAVRFFCHCGICQKLYKLPVADVTILSQSDIILPMDHNIRFEKYRSIVGIDRGTCRDCYKPVVALAGSGDKGLAFIAAANYANTDVLPAPKIHIFYDRCVNEIVDDLPKYKGYIRSQFAVLRLMRSSALGS